MSDDDAGGRADGADGLADDADGLDLDDGRHGRPVVRPFSLALASPLSTARGTIGRREGFLVGVEAEVDGERARGVGEATPLPGWTESREACREALSSVPPDGWDAHFADRGAPAACHGYQLALLDATARGRGIRLADLLAGRPARARDGAVRIAPDAGGETPTVDPADRVPVNAAIGDGGVGETADAAARAIESGYRCLKLKVGARPLADDLDRVRAVVDTAGGPDADVSVRLDANGAWDRETAGRAVEAAADLGIEYVEQPLPAADLDGLADLRGRGVEIAVDETLAERDARDVLDAGAADVAILKPMALGGPGAAAGLARHLRSNGVDPVVTTTIDAAVARAAAVHVAAAIPDVRPCGLATGDLLAEDLGPDPAPVSGGTVPVPDGPGVCGAAFDGQVW